MAVCTDCGTLRPLNGIGVFIKEAGKGESGKGGNGEGGSSRGGSGRGDSSETTTAYAAPAYAEKLSGEALKAVDGDREFACAVCEMVGIEFEQDLPQTIVLGGTEMIIRLWV